jgi:hypothetical protein
MSNYTLLSKERGKDWKRLEMRYSSEEKRA